jgi:hypothetical protein
MEPLKYCGLSLMLWALQFICVGQLWYSKQMDNCKSKDTL